MSDNTLPLIASTLRIEGRKGLGGVRKVLEASNTAFTNGLAGWAYTFWAGYSYTGTSGAQPPITIGFPWKHPSGKYTNDTSITVQKLRANTTSVGGWPAYFGSQYYLGNATTDRDYFRYYMRQSISISLNAAFIPFVLGSVGVAPLTNEDYNGYPDVMSIAEVPGTQIGNYFPHPLGPNAANYMTTLVNTAAGSNYASAMGTNSGTPPTFGTYNNNYDHEQFRPGVVDTIRITTGAEKGIYHVRTSQANANYAANTMWTGAAVWLRHIDGSVPSWASQTNQTIYFNNRAAYGNETGVIALSAGSVTLGGTFAPGVNRNSYMFKIRYDKSGNTTAGTTQGSYWFSAKPYTHGADGGKEHLWTNSILFGRNDTAASATGLTWWNNKNNAQVWFPSGTAVAGSIKSYALDPTTQRLWYAISNGSTTSGIGWWLYKTQEGVHEVASTTGLVSGSAALLTGSITMASTMCYSVDAGTDGTIYAALYSNASTNAGLVVITPALVATTYNNAGGGCPGTKFTCAKVDKTKWRSGVDASFSGTNQFVSASGAFSTLDLGRVIKITGGANAGTYKISAINSATNVTVVVPSTGAAVTWANNALTSQTWNIGDRIWCMFNDTTTNSGKLYYMESTLLGTWLAQTVTMTNGKQCGVSIGDLTPAHAQCAAVDPKNGNLYWISTDTLNQVNQYTPGASTVLSIDGATLGSRNGADASMTSAGNTLTSATGNFTTAVDLNRIVTVTTGANAGCYKISVVNSTTNVTVTTIAGGVVSWPSTLASQPWSFSRTGADASMTAAGNTMTTTGSYFSASDVGNFLTISGGANAGTYYISAVNSATNITVTNQNTNVAMSWPSTLASQTWIVGTKTNTNSVKNPTGTLAITGCFTCLGVNPVFNELWVGSVDSATGTGLSLFRFDTSITFNASNWLTDTTLWGNYNGPASYNNALGYNFSAEANSGYSNAVNSIAFGIDGKVIGSVWNQATGNARYQTMFFTYNREADTFTSVTGGGYNNNGDPANWYCGAGLWTVLYTDPYGGGCWLNPNTTSGSIMLPTGGVFHMETHYQWINSAWTPKEVVRGPLPAKSIADNAAYATGLKTKPLHSTADALIYGATIQFTQTAGTSYNDFVGRFAITLDNKSDGATTAGTATTATFTGSGFAAADAGRYLRLESGANAGVYKITTYTDANHVIIGLLNGSPFTLSTLSALNYSVWDAGDPTGASGINGGPETGTVVLANGFGKDNTQDISGIQMDLHIAKTLLADQTDSIKFAMDPPGPAGSTALQIYSNAYNSNGTIPFLGGGTTRHIGVDASTLQAAPNNCLDGLTDRFLDGTASRTGPYTNNWQNYVNMDTGGNSSYGGAWVVVDLGKDVEVGSTIMRRGGSANYDLYGADGSAQVQGYLGELDVAADGPTPSHTYSRSGSDGTTASGGSTLTSATAAFTTADVGRSLVLTGTNIGTYVITSFTSSTQVSISPSTFASTQTTNQAWNCVNIRCTGTQLYSGSGTAGNLSTGAGSSPAGLGSPAGTWAVQTTNYNGTFICCYTGNFMGSVVAGFPRTVGSIVAAGNVLTDAAAGFTQAHVGYAVNITAGSAADIGWYRVASVVTGTSVTLAPLSYPYNNPTSSFVNTVAAGITYTLNNAVQQGDVIGTGTNKNFIVYAVMEPTLIWCQAYTGVALTNSAWTCYAPNNFNLVKKLFVGSFSNYYQQETIGNKTFQSPNSKNRGSVWNDPGEWYDLSDLSTAKRTGRWWKFALSPTPAWTKTNSANFGPNISLTTDQIEFYDPTGKNLITCAYNRVDQFDSNANFMRANVTRVDWIPATNSSIGAGAFNGLVGISGTSATLTTGSNKFLGNRVRRSPSGSGVTAAGANNILVAGANFFMQSDVGRMLWVSAGGNAGYYRVLAVTNATTVTLVTPSGGAVTLATDGVVRIIELYEGIASGDYLAITTGGVNNTNVEYQISAISNDLVTITLTAGPASPIVSQNWEIRRRANLISTTCWNQVIVSGSYALSSGDFHTDSSGHFKTAPIDQTAYTTAAATAVFSAKTDGATTISTGTFTGSDFCPDDVGRVILIQSGVDKGHYKISAYTNSTTVTVQNLYTGAAVSFGATASTLSYILKGDRRLRVSRYTAVLRA